MGDIPEMRLSNPSSVSDRDRPMVDHAITLASLMDIDGPVTVPGLGILQRGPGGYTFTPDTRFTDHEFL